MTRFIIACCFFPLISISQQLEAFLSSATFSLNQGENYLETYLFFDANTVSLIDSGEKKYHGIIKTNIKLVENKKVIYEDTYTLTSPDFLQQKYNDVFFVDQQRIPIKNGSYTLIIQIKDINSKKEPKNLSEEIIVDFPINKASISDIQLIESYNETEGSTILSKSGYELTPFISNFYPESVKRMMFYFECYNTNIEFNQEEKYLLNIYIETFDTKRPLFNFNKTKRKQAKDIEGNLFVFNIDELPTGNYNLVCEIRNISNESIAKKKLFFQRRGSIIAQKNQDINVVNIEGTFAELITNIDSLSLYIDYLYPISTTHENSFAMNQKSYNNLELMQKYFYNFWKARNLTNPEEPWINYHDQVKRVNRSFKNINILGYLTDRGRVYLQYGPPNSRHEVENATSTVPYEIWHYYKLHNQSDKKFVFVNNNFSLNEYKLVYSNVDGEVSNSEWRDRIDQDINPTLGDDFNNNYINPR